MSYLIDAVFKSDEKSELREFVNHLQASQQRYLLRNDILNAFSHFCTQKADPDTFYQSSRLGKLIYYTQEIILEEESLCLIIRPKIARQEAYRLLEDLTVEPLSVQELLDIRDRFVGHFHPEEGDVFEIDFQSFYDYSPAIRDPKNIGKGVQFLNRFLSSKLFQDPQQWLSALFTFLSLHSYKGVVLLINGRIIRQRLSCSKMISWV